MHSDKTMGKYPHKRVLNVITIYAKIVGLKIFSFSQVVYKIVIFMVLRYILTLYLGISIHYLAIKRN